MFDLICSSLTKSFTSRTDAQKQRTPVDRLSTTFAAGEISTIIGESGCGKTTLLRLLAGLETPDSGTVTYSENGTQGRPKIGMVFQEPRLFPWLTVEENVALAVRRLPEKERRQRVQQTLEIVGLAGRANALSGELSGGMAQRAGFARALVRRPDILLMDEPFSALDALTRERLRSEFVRIFSHSPMTVVLVTHDVWEAALLSRSIYKLADGALQKLTEIDTAYPRRIDDMRITREVGRLMESFCVATD